jgi:predicted permease
MNAAATTLFALLAKALPRSFRGRYGEDMLGDFEAELRESDGFGSALGYALAAYADVIATAMNERFATLRSDLLFSWRSIRKSPGFAIVIVVTLALAIGANTASLSVLRAVVLAPLPFPHADRIAVLQSVVDGKPGEGVSLPDLHDIEHAQTSIVAAGGQVFYAISHVLRQNGRSIAVDAATVTPGFFDVFGLAPEAGRYFRDVDARAGAAKTIVLSDRFWRKYYGADRAIVGRMIELDGTRYRVIGVTTAAFSPTASLNEYDAWTVLVAGSSESYERDAHVFDVPVRIAAGSTIAQTQRELDRIDANLRARYPLADAKLDFHVTPLLEDVVGEYGPTILAISWAALGLLVIACANVVNLMLGRASAREYEIFVRLSLGAARSRIIAQLLTETFVLVALGGALGVGLAFAAIALLLASHPDFIPRVQNVSIDPSTLAFTALIVIAATTVAGLVPALSLSRRNLTLPLAGAGRGGSMGRGAAARAALVVFEIACTLALVVLGGLAVRNYAALVAAPLGFEPTGVTVIGPLQVTESRYQNPEARESFYRAARSKVAAMPGVLDAAWAFDAPFVYDILQLPFTVLGGPSTPAADGSVVTNDIDPGYFHALQIPTRMGRTFDARDRAGSTNTLLVNEAFAKTYLRGRSPVGTRIRFDTPGQNKSHDSTYEIVGVVGDTRRAYTLAAVPTVYRAFGKNSPYIGVLLVRTNPAMPTADYAAKILSVDPTMVAPTVRTLQSMMDDSTVRSRVTMGVLTALAGVALALSIAGVYAVVSYGVSLRAHEFGVRMALGSIASRIQRDVVLRSMRVAFVGIGIGIVLAGLIVRALPLSFTAIEPLDPATFAGVVAIVTLAALVAAFIPAWRATRVDPMIALRSE